MMLLILFCSLTVQLGRRGYSLVAALPALHPLIDNQGPVASGLPPT
jgi:hypothetical protein